MKNKSQIDEWWASSFDQHKAHVYAQYKKGVFIDINSGKPVKFKENTLVKIIVPSESLPEESRKHHLETERVVFLSSGSNLYFRFRDDKGSQREFKVALGGDLYIERKGDKFGRLSPCHCRMYDDTNKCVGQAGSLNEAYTKISAKYRQDARTHTANVFKAFWHEGKRLEDIRPF
ncbi:hypothetical protein L6250_02940 [Candidatus Parcubacteria bacterium]|nr:hypothetical protein [Candidatus Parcubacteria bacterium]